MFYKYFFYILLIFAVVLTIGLCITKPQMHTVLMVYDSDYKIVDTKKVETTKKTSNVTTEKLTPQANKTKAVTKTTKSTKQLNAQKTTAASAPKQVKTKAQNKSQEAVSKVQQQKTVSVNKVAPITQTKAETKYIPQPKEKVLTSAQEEIEWNKWRSNLQNQIMRDSKLPILPQGTVFKFSFDVDKYGRVTNVQAWSLTPSYTPYAIQNIAPVIKSYQGHSILNFPIGSKRVMTTVTGQWKISSSQKYSTSANFHDIETVKKGY